MEELNFQWERNNNDIRLCIIGNLVLQNLPIQLTTDFFKDNSNKKILIIDFQDTIKIDTSGVNALLLALKELGFNQEDIIYQNISENQDSIIKLVQERAEKSQIEQKDSTTFIYQSISNLGLAIIASLQIFHSHFIIIGQLVSSIFFYLWNPKKIRFREIFTQLYQTGILAIPVVILVTFLIGIVMAYLLGMQAEKFGASIFVVDGVALAMCREMSPILVAIILAGRSGSAFTAQLGAMKLTEEIDALKSIGLKSFDVLIFPRIFALVIALPLLVFVGDIAGMFGGMLVTDQYLGLSSTSFMERLEQVLSLKHILVGLIKAPAFAIAIGLIACRIGTEVEKDARSVGLSTTKTVVRSIVIVILMNATFSVIFANIGF